MNYQQVLWEEIVSVAVIAVLTFGLLYYWGVSSGLSRTEAVRVATPRPWVGWAFVAFMVFALGEVLVLAR